MTTQSQQSEMRRLRDLLSRNLGYLHGEREGGPNGDKKIFLHVGKAFLRVLAKDLGLRNAVVKSNAAGIAVSGECTLYGMWEENGIYICIGQFGAGGENVLLYRTIHSLKDCRGGYNNWIRLDEFGIMPYKRLLEQVGALRKDHAYDRAA